MRAIELVRVIREGPDIFSLWFRDIETRSGIPGQYLMVWNPGVDEVPMSISTIVEDGLSSFTVRIVGEATRALCSLQPGDKIGLRGPFGNGYRVEGDNVLLVGGGTGVASLYPLAKSLRDKEVDVTLINGARSADRLLFERRLNTLLGDRQLIATDDGSMGFRGYASVYASQVMEEEDFDRVYTCGPELMMAIVYDEADKRGIPVQAGLERYIKCAVGLCGSCAIGSYRVCKDGPIFDSEMLAKVGEEFGKMRMDASGRRIRVVH